MFYRCLMLCFILILITKKEREKKENSHLEDKLQRNIDEIEEKERIINIIVTIIINVLEN